MTAADRVATAAAALMVGFLGWLCVQMAITDWKAEVLMLIGGGIVVAVLALLVGVGRRAAGSTSERKRPTGSGTAV